jgi:hypothetical protein
MVKQVQFLVTYYSINYFGMDRNDNEIRTEKLQDTNEGFPDMTPRRIGGDDSLSETSPIDSRADEKVLTNRNRNNNSNNNETVRQGNDDKNQSGTDDQMIER